VLKPAWLMALRVFSCPHFCPSDLPAYTAFYRPILFSVWHQCRAQQSVEPFDTWFRMMNNRFYSFLAPVAVHDSFPSPSSSSAPRTVPYRAAVFAGSRCMVAPARESQRPSPSPFAQR